MKKKHSFWLTNTGLVALCAIAFIAYFLLVEHRHHLAEWLPYLIILLCPLMHLFMHHNHTHHNKNDKGRPCEEFKRGYKADLHDRNNNNRSNYDLTKH